MQAYRIVQATQGQMAEVAEVFKASFRHTYPNFPEIHTAEEDREFFTNSVFKKNSVHVVEAAGTKEIVGFIAFNHEFIDHLYILPGHVRTGLGSRLIKIAMEKPRVLRLWTFQQNTTARAFYGRHGFVEIKETDGAETEEKQPDVLLERQP